ncbi:hypothetical protein L9F63_020334, partial [Diploptera punctata]
WMDNVEQDALAAPLEFLAQPDIISLMQPFLPGVMATESSASVVATAATAGAAVSSTTASTSATRPLTFSIAKIMEPDKRLSEPCPIRPRNPTSRKLKLRRIKQQLHQGLPSSSYNPPPSGLLLVPYQLPISRRASRVRNAARYSTRITTSPDTCPCTRVPVHLSAKST